MAPIHYFAYSTDEKVKFGFQSAQAFCATILNATHLLPS